MSEPLTDEERNQLAVYDAARRETIDKLLVYLNKANGNVIDAKALAAQDGVRAIGRTWEAVIDKAFEGMAEEGKP